MNGSISTCCICNKNGIYDYRATLQLLSNPSKYNFKVFRCKECDFRWLHPLPIIEKIYTKDYFNSEDNNYSDISSEMSKCFTEDAIKFKELSLGGQILDIGCATGEFLEAIQSVGLNGVGVDVANYAVDVATRKKLSVIQGDIFYSIFDSKRFDGIHMSHVLEHIPHPNSFLCRTNELLQKNGIVYIEVPLQFDSWLEKISRIQGKMQSFELYKFHHCSFFTPKSIRLILEKNNFQIISLTTFRSCRRSQRKLSARYFLLTLILWVSDKIYKRGDVISVWAKTSLSSEK
ncbi:MAG: 2-polyprenyl-3-methyl-5-hydroxy-6-metoxy-1,4-benzoquinol methylase [Candidatus Electronema aureum]|uniref:2-polyprenyl-3-methyl-5-hydroxy-6-metoxy-1, 4-benzoquinol methylase n=1 Tax=Candidatus Electronema aureum TaxID=2005002 RepID=A0A521G0A5_9BACT|nr:MAG: 2-polyprenyl-3-methyl-5-hydroxy-6-metoxy-1,4-benzoquinol methylase [Candidatus Electronema aureum]